MSTPAPRNDRRAHAVFGLTAASIIALSSAPAQAEGTRAGSLINNTATATFDNGGTPATVSSNTVTLKVDEIVDVAVATRDGGDASVGAGSTGNVRSFTITNVGNGAEAYVLTATGDVDGNSFDPAVTQIAVDANGNGTYESGVDTIVADGGRSAAIEPDAGLTVFVISSAPADAADTSRGEVRLRAVAETGSGPAGTVFTGRGADGGDAVVGATTASADADGGFIISRASVRFDKSAVVLDPFGGARALPGSIVTYRLSALIQGSGAVPGLRVRDAIPVGTSYVPGSLTLDGAALTDGADGDAGAASSSAIDVLIGSVPAGSTRVTEFKVKID